MRAQVLFSHFTVCITLFIRLVVAELQNNIQDNQKNKAEGVFLYYVILLIILHTEPQYLEENKLQF